MFSRPTYEQALALAAVFQSCELVAELAHNGDIAPASLELCMSALLNQNPESIEDIYGSEKNLAIGIASMKALMGGSNTEPSAQEKEQEQELKQELKQEQRPEVMRYVISILYLARKVSGNKKMLNSIGNGIENAARQAQHFSPTHDNVCGNIASLYQDTVSTMRLRIQVSGSGLYLQQPAVAQRIRCLLFSAIRSAFLWQQLGGKRTHLMLQRKTLARLLPNL